jgi:hypothetical protein
LASSRPSDSARWRRSRRWDSSVPSSCSAGSRSGSATTWATRRC